MCTSLAFSQFDFTKCGTKPSDKAKLYFYSDESKMCMRKAGNCD